MKLKHSFLIACLSATPLCAQQEDKNEVKKTDKAEASAAAATNGNVKVEIHSSDGKAQHGQPSRNPNPAPPQPEQKPVAYLGVLTREVPPELRSQFSLPEGFGLMVDEVMPDSPAKTAGLKVHDVLVKFEDQQLVNMEQLMSLVRAKKKGEVVNLDVITGGKATKVPVTVGERMVAANDHRQQHGYTGWTQQNGMPLGGGEFRLFQNQGNEVGEQMERLREEMREYQERVQEWMKGNKASPMPQAPNFNQSGQSHRGERHDGQPHQTGNGPQPGNVQQFNFSEAHAAANITRRDESGEYSIKNDDGSKTFTVRSTDGKEQSWPINSEDERKAVPEQFRDKLRMMDGANGGIRIEVRPDGGHSHDSNAPKGGNNPGPAPQPRAKGRPTST